MALSLYLGPPGSGKSYEAVSSVLVPAYQSGRTIVTNIKGVDPDFWAANLEPAKDCQLGTIKVVEEAFFHDELNYPLMSKEGQNLEPGAIPAGALVVIDEAYMVFPTGADSGVTKRMIEYVRTHRHFVSETGVASDMVLISQDVMSLHARIRAVAEFCVTVRNMRHLGLGGRYRVNVYNHWKMTKSSEIGQSQRRYKEGVFKLYKSFEAEGSAKVVMTDKSHRALKWYHMAFLALALGLCGYAATRFNGATHALRASEITASVTGTKIQKRECSGSGVLVDLSDRRVFQDGQWRKVDAMFTGDDGRARWDVGPCIIAFGSGVVS